MRLNTKTKRFASRKIVQSPIQLRLSNRKYRGVDRAQYQTRYNLTLFHSHASTFSLPFASLSRSLTRRTPSCYHRWRTATTTFADSVDFANAIITFSFYLHPQLTPFPLLYHLPSPASSRSIYIYLPTAARLG